LHELREVGFRLVHVDGSAHALVYHA
jgi:hypothetical protein